ncbi:MAG: CoB--CoM heterodisulfide reductase iron-sulfur subunit B family protein [Thermodesulfobacteriota bacterium]
MEFALFRCCPTSLFMRQYETSTDAVLRRLGVRFRDVKEFNCCGYPLRNLNFKAYILAAARNLALAEQRGVGILTVCNCCYGSLKHAQTMLSEDHALRDEITACLRKESLIYTGQVKVRHLLDVLHKDIGLISIREKIRRVFRPDLKVATHYGCRILRPSRTVEFDNPTHPVLFDELVEATGAESIPWSAKLDCCGSSLWGTCDELSMDLAQRKIRNARESGATCLCVSCVYCQLQFDRVQQILLSGRAGTHQLPSILFPQLLGLSLGIDPRILGIDRNCLDMQGVMSYLSRD